MTRKRRAAGKKAPATRDRKDPFRGYKFKLEIDGIRRAGFRECSGLDVTSDVVDYREGTDKPNTPRELSGQSKYTAITLRWGITDDNSLWDWHKKVAAGELERKKRICCSNVLRQGEDALGLHKWTANQVCGA